ncbi:MAG: hypothetical protein KDJ22_01915 [Candidatus Competibacteraceae bacterium]|nr:hypothetical protein [Candidatus Competibacteraceae bacterium]MCP5126753.1 hypothetical protein [Gammaproteobacteria bacterium]
MHPNTCRKIAKQHSQETPGWVVRDIAPSEWAEQAIQPLLVDLTTPPPRFEPYQERSSPTWIIPDDCSAKIPARLIGCIHLSIESEPHNNYGRSYYYDWGRSVVVPLYWVDASDGSHQVAIAPERVGEHGYYYPLLKMDELRYLASPEALRALLKVFLDGLRQRAFKQRKASKVRNLQTQAIQAQVRQIANEERFAFRIATSARLIRIEVRLDENNQLTLSVPFTEFENALPQLREMIVNLRALHQRRIRFKTHQCGYRSGSWIEPDLPPEVDSISS